MFLDKSFRGILIVGKNVFVFCCVNTNGKIKKSFASQGVLFLQRHPALISLGIIGCFLIAPSSSSVMAASWWDTLTTPTAWLNALIYPFFLFFSWIVNLVAGLS